MQKEKILDVLKTTLNFKEEFYDKYLQLTLIAINQIESKLKKGADKNSYVLVMLCAAMVNLWVNMEICSNSPSGSFSGNGYRITKNSRRQYELSQKLFDHWRAQAANFLVDEGFSFFATKKMTEK